VATISCKLVHTRNRIGIHMGAQVAKTYEGRCTKSDVKDQDKIVMEILDEFKAKGYSFLEHTQEIYELGYSAAAETRETAWHMLLSSLFVLRLNISSSCIIYGVKTQCQIARPFDGQSSMCKGRFAVDFKRMERYDSFMRSRKSHLSRRIVSTQ